MKMHSSRRTNILVVLMLLAVPSSPDGATGSAEQRGATRLGAVDEMASQSEVGAKIQFVLQMQPDGRLFGVRSGCLFIDARVDVVGGRAPGGGAAAATTVEELPVVIEWRVSWDVDDTDWIEDVRDPRVVVSGSRQRLVGGSELAMSLCRADLEALARVPANEFIVLVQVGPDSGAGESIRFVSGPNGEEQRRRRFYIDKERLTRARIEEVLSAQGEGASRPVDGRTMVVDCGDGIGLEMVEIPSGVFMMGSIESESDRESNELRRSVMISQAFWLGKTEVTLAQWDAVMESNPNRSVGDPNHPVVEVSWEDAQEFCRRLSTRSGRRFRLPTEAEWEYACRSGSTSAYSFGGDPRGLDQHAWFSSNSEGGPKAVATKSPNSWGLHDMHGNVSEWCSDWYGVHFGEAAVDPGGPTSGSYRVVRGGSWKAMPPRCRSAYRGVGRAAGDASIGFRVAMSP